MPALAAWGVTTEATRRVMSPTKDSSTLTDSHPLFHFTNKAANATGCIRQYVSDPMDAGIAFAASDTIKSQVRVKENNVTNNINRQPIFIKVVSQNGVTLRATLKAIGHIGPSTTEWATTLTNRTFADSDTLDASYTTVSGDRLVVEFGGQVSGAGGTNCGGYFQFGSSAGSDLPENESSTSALDPWFEISRTITFLTITPPSAPPARACQSPLVGHPPSPDYKETLCDVSTLAELMAYSQDNNDGNDYYYPVETPGKRMLNAAGMTLVNDTSAANHVNYLLLGSAPNPGENGYSFQNIESLFPADLYPEFWNRFIMRKMEGGNCFTGDVSILTPNLLQGVGFWRDNIGGFIRMISYFDVESTGDFTSPLTDQTFYTDLIQVDTHWTLLSHAPDITFPSEEVYQVALDITVKVNGVVAAPVRYLTGQVISDRLDSDPDNDICPWFMLVENFAYGDDAAQLHGWEWAIPVPQYGGVTRYTQTLAGGKLDTVVGLGGQPRGGYKRWRALGAEGFEFAPPIIPPVATVHTLTETTTILSAAYTDTAINLPDYSIIVSVAVEVTVAIPTATSFNVGDSANTTRFATGVATTLGATDPGIDSTGYFNLVATPVRLTMVGGVPASTVGRVKVTINYIPPVF